MSEIAKRLERAEKHLQKGKLPAALEEFKAILAEDPANDYARQRAADLALSLGLTAEAAAYLGEIYDKCIAQNRQQEAIQAYRKLQRLGSVTPERTFRLAQILERSSPREALEFYHSAFQRFVGRGDKPQARATLREILKFEPTLQNFRREAELAMAMGDRQAASLAHFQIAQLEENEGQDGSVTFEQAYLLDPDNPALALAHARCQLRANRPEMAVEVLRTHQLGTADFLETYAHALLMSNQLEAAEPVVAKFYEHSPKAITLMGVLLDGYLKQGRSLYAMGLAKSLEGKVRTRGDLKDYSLLIQELAEKNAEATDFLEYLAHLYNTSNREHEYCETLLKLYGLHFAQRNFVKAAECLDRASEVDAYEPGHAERLEMLRGKIDANKFNTIANRLSSVARTGTEEEEADEIIEQPQEESSGEPTVLEDLMLQAEIFLQYSMKAKAVERLERINRLFPHEEEKREKLSQLFAAAGFAPRYEEFGAKTQGSQDERAVDSFARVTEITRNIARQSSVKSVLFATVNDIGRQWGVSRCVAGLCAPGKAPSAAMEYCAPGTAKSDVMGIARLISTLQGQTIKTGTAVSYLHAQKAPELEGIRAVLTAQKIESLIAIPLMDRDDPIGIVILEQCGTARQFRNVDQVILNTIAEQIVIAVNNAKLRTLVKTLAVTDEKSGLLRRSSYLDVLLSEAQRGVQQKSPATIVLMSFGSASALLKEVGEVKVEAAMQEIGQVVTSNIRQNDIAVRYSLTNIALILADTSEKNSIIVVDKLRKATSSIRFQGRVQPLAVTAGIAELVMNAEYEPADIVTEAINRVETALELAKHEGGDRVHAMAPMNEASVVSA